MARLRRPVTPEPEVLILPKRLLRAEFAPERRLWLEQHEIHRWADQHTVTKASRRHHGLSIADARDFFRQEIS